MTTNTTTEPAPPPRRTTPTENRVVIMALIGFFAIVVAVAIVPSFLNRKKERQPNTLPAPVECTKGLTIDNQKHCQRAKEYEKKCLKGNPDACWHLGGFYLEDDNQEFDRVTGIRWLQHGCKLGSENSCAWMKDLLEP